MQVTVEASEGLKRRIRVVIPAEEYKKTYYAAIRKIGRTNRIPGFRKGRVPDDIILSRFGYQVREDYTNELIGRTMYRAAAEAGIESVTESAPLVENIGDNGISEDFSYTFSVEVYPEVDLGEGLETVKFSRVRGEISEADVDRMIETLRRQQGVWEDAAGPIAKGHLVTLDLQGLKDGAEVKSATAKNFRMIVGANHMIPGFEDNILGHGAGDEFEFTVTFPADYHNAELAGAPVLFKVKVGAVSERKPAEFNEEFIRSFGVSGDAAAFRADVRKNMERELSQVVFRRNCDEVMDKLIARYGSFDLPERELANMVSAAGRDRQKNGAPVSEAEEKMIKASCEKALRQRIIVTAICKKYGIVPDESRVNAYIDTIAAAYDRADEFKKAVAKDAGQYQSIRNRAVSEQIVDAVLEKGDTTAETKTFYELVHPEF